MEQTQNITLDSKEIISINTEIAKLIGDGTLREYHFLFKDNFNNNEQRVQGYYHTEKMKFHTHWNWLMFALHEVTDLNRIFLDEESFSMFTNKKKNILVSMRFNEIYLFVSNNVRWIQMMKENSEK